MESVVPKLVKGPEIIRTAIDWAKTRQLGPDARAQLEQINWDRIADLTIKGVLFDETPIAPGLVWQKSIEVI
jgi:hypothetical protein